MVEKLHLLLSVRADLVALREVLDQHCLRYDASYLESEDYDLLTRLLAVAEADNLVEPLAPAG